MVKRPRNPAPVPQPESTDELAHRLRAGKAGFRKWLAMRGPYYFEKAEAVIDKALAVGDTQTAALVICTLLKKVAPDAASILEAEDEPVDAAPGAAHARINVLQVLKVLQRVDVSLLEEGDDGGPRDGADAAADEVHPVDADTDAGGLPPSR